MATARNVAALGARLSSLEDALAARERRLATLSASSAGGRNGGIVLLTAVVASQSVIVVLAVVAGALALGRAGTSGPEPGETPVIAAVAPPHEATDDPTAAGPVAGEDGTDENGMDAVADATDTPDATADAVVDAADDAAVEPDSVEPPPDDAPAHAPVDDGHTEPASPAPDDDAVADAAARSASPRATPDIIPLAGVVKEFPATLQGSTADSTVRRIDRYGCAPDTSEGGPERWYRVDVPRAGYLSAWLSSEPSPGVDVDVHLLATGNASSCLERHHVAVGRHVTPGSYWIVVDTYTGGTTPGGQPGAFTLQVGLDGD